MLACDNAQCLLSLPDQYRCLSVYLCADIDACKNNACKNSGAGNVQCTDKGLGFADTPDGRECRCDSGYFYTEASGCQSKGLWALACTTDLDQCWVLLAADCKLMKDSDLGRRFIDAHIT
jgi:hypothetical protein